MSGFMNGGLAGAVQSGSILAFALAYGAGVLSSLTPCVFPLIPVTVSILGAGKATSRSHAFFLSLMYVLGISFTYACLGMLAALTGSLFGSVSSNPWVLLGVAVLILLLALNMLDVYYLRLPGLDLGGAGTQRRIGPMRNFAYGASFGLIASPCTAPPLAAILAWVGASHSLVRGPLLLFAFALGMGTLLLLLGTFASLLSLMPRAGGWMVGVKKGMGFLMLAMGCYFVFQAGRQW